MNHLKYKLLAFFLLAAVGLSGCSGSNVPAARGPIESQSLAPQRVDIRGIVSTSRYSQGEVMLEIEGVPSSDSRYNRAYVLVTPVTQIFGVNGESISLSELQQGQRVAALLRGGGDGTFVGVGVARKLWVEPSF